MSEWGIDELENCRAEITRLHERLADSERTIVELSDRLARRDAKLARIEALCERLDANGGVAYPKAIRHTLADRPTYG